MCHRQSNTGLGWALMTLAKMMSVMMTVLMLICSRIYDNDDTAAAAHSDADAAAAAADADADAADDDGLGEDGCDGAATPAGRRPRPRE